MKKRRIIIISMGILFLLIISIGIIIFLQNNKNELMPHRDTTTENKTTIDTSDLENNISKKKTTTTSDAKEESSSKDSITTVSTHTTNLKGDHVKNTTTSEKTTKKNTISSSKIASTKLPVTTQKTTTKATSDEVDALRTKLENTYHITIKYGDELGNYRPKGLTPTKMTDKEEIKKHLKLMENELKKYPVGFFKEFSGMPLTIYLVRSVTNNAFAGFTDKEFMNNIKITLTKNFLFEYTFNHEIMHYIDAYLEIKMYPKNPYDEYMLLNPQGYQYGKALQSYNYGYNQQVRGAYFLNDYSQSNVREDRAEIFKQMITRLYKPVGMFDDGETIQKKALVIDKQIRDNFKSAKGTLYWDKIVR